MHEKVVGNAEIKNSDNGAEVTTTAHIGMWPTQFNLWHPI